MKEVEAEFKTIMNVICPDCGKVHDLMEEDNGDLMELALPTGGNSNLGYATFKVDCVYCNICECIFNVKGYNWL